MIAGMKNDTHSPPATRSTRQHIAPEPAAAPPHAATPSRAAGTSAPRGLEDKVAWVAIGDLKPFPGNPRRHPEEQITRLMRSIERGLDQPDSDRRDPHDPCRPCTP